MQLSDFRVVSVSPRRRPCLGGRDGLCYYCAVYQLLRYMGDGRMRLRTAAVIGEGHKDLDSARAYVRDYALRHGLPVAPCAVGEAVWEGHLGDLLESDTASDDYKERLRHFIVLEALKRSV